MNHTHDPQKQVGYMQQCLSNDKRPLGLFLGAGCPMAVRGENGESLIRDIAGITEIVREKMKSPASDKSKFETIEKQLDQDNQTVEGILTHIRALQAVAGNDKVRGLSAGELERLDTGICDIIHQTTDKELPDVGTPYHHIASWVDAVHRESPVEIFTTNYDLLLEQAFERLEVPYFDGFSGARRPFFLWTMEKDILPPRWTRLWKLHGSINWYLGKDNKIFRGTTQESDNTKRLIHPSHLKYQESRKMPYLAIFDRLREFLKYPTATLILCGYSFKDDHINEVILQGLQYTQTAIAFGLLFEEIDKYPEAIKLTERRTNLTLLAKDGAVIGGQKSNWAEQPHKSEVPKAAGQTDNTNQSNAPFTLGDFEKFGQFLQSLVGNTQQSEATNNGK